MDSGDMTFMAYEQITGEPIIGAENTTYEYGPITRGREAGAESVTHEGRRIGNMG